MLTSTLQRVQEIYQTERSRVLATLIRLLGNMETAEEALQDAFAAAIEQLSCNKLNTERGSRTKNISADYSRHCFAAISKKA